MNNDLIAKTFRPRVSQGEAKADAITQNVRAIQKAESESRDAKTARLRALRLSMAAIDAA